MDGDTYHIMRWCSLQYLALLKFSSPPQRCISDPPYSHFSANPFCQKCPRATAIAASAASNTTKTAAGATIAAATITAAAATGGAPTPTQLRHPASPFALGRCRPKQGCPETDSWMAVVGGGLVVAACKHAERSTERGRRGRRGGVGGGKSSSLPSTAAAAGAGGERPGRAESC